MAKAQPNPLQEAAKQWNQRLSQASQLARGNPSRLKPVVDLAVNDLKNVYHGGSAMTNNEATAAMYSVLTGQDLVNKQHGASHHSLLNTLFGVVPNAVKDVGQMAMAFPAGLYHSIVNLPKETERTVGLIEHGGNRQWLQKHGYDPKAAGSLFDTSTWSAALRNLSQPDQLSNFLPGITTAARLTTAQGRHDVYQHPVQTFLDILPYVAGPGAELAKLGNSFTLDEAVDAGLNGADAVNKAIDAQRLLNEGKIDPADPNLNPETARALSDYKKLQENFQGRPLFNGVYKMVTPGSAEEAMFKGNPVRAAMSYMDDTLIPRITGGKLDPGYFGHMTDEFLRRATLGKFDRNAAREFAIKNRYIRSQWNDFQEKLKPFLFKRDEKGKWIARSPEERTQIEQVISHAVDDPKSYGDILGNRTPIPADIIPLVEQARQLSNDVQAMYEKDTFWHLPVGGKVVTYASSPQEKALRKAHESYKDETSKLRSLTESHANARRSYAKSRRASIANEATQAKNAVEAAQAKVDALTNQLFTSDSAEIIKAKEQLTAAQTKLLQIQKEASAVTRIDQTGSTAGFGSLPLDSMPADFRTAERSYREQVSKAANAHRTFTDALAHTPPQYMEPLVADKLRQIATDHYTKNAAAGAIADPKVDVQRALDDIKNGVIDPYFTPAEWAKIQDEAITSWQQMLRDGFNPVFEFKVHPGEVDRINDLALNSHLPSIAEKQNFDLTSEGRRLSNYAVATERAAMQPIVDLAKRAFAEDMIRPYAKSWDQLKPDIAKDAARAGITETREGFTDTALQDILVQRGWRKWNPSATLEYGFQPITETTSDLTKFAADHKDILYVPEWMDRSISTLVKSRPWQKSVFGRGITGSTNVMKVSVMTLSPKHLAHIMFGGLFFIMAGGGRDEVMSALQAWHMARHGGQGMPEQIPRSMQSVDIQDHFNQVTKDIVSDPNKLVRFAAGRTMMRMWKGLAGDIGGSIDQVRKLEDFIGNVQRSMAYLGEEKRALRKGFSQRAAVEMGLRHAEKMLVDFDSMTPIEKAIVREAFPFYAYTRHITQYVLNLPIDHPLRASIMSKMASQENQQWNADLPQTFQRLFWVGGGLGSPPAHGQAIGLDVRALNPLRDMERIYSWQGFISSLNPAFQVALEQLGFNTATGQPDLFPNLIVDPMTGTFKAAPSSSGLIEGVGTFIPQIDVLDHFFQWSDRMRNLARTNPDAYRKSIFDSLMTPSWQNVNIDVQKGTVAKRYMQEATTAVSNVASGRAEPSSLDQYQVVPYQGQLLPGRTVAAIMEYLNSISGGAAPKAITPRKAPTFKRKA